MLSVGVENLCGIAEEVLRKGALLSFVAGGSSMSPFIKDGDTVVVGPASSLEVGDVVLCKVPGGGLILHRVVEKTPSGVVTRGDACPDGDGRTPRGDVLGKAIKVSGGGFNFHLRHPFGMLIARGLFRPSRFPGHRLLLVLARRLASFLGRSR